MAAGCSNTPSNKIRLYKFPSDPRIREKWIKQVRRTRLQWTATRHSVLCSEHFTECFAGDTAIASSFGIPKKRRLKPDAVPSIFHRPSTAIPCSSGTAQAQPVKRTAATVLLSAYKRSRATEKRDRTRVCSETVMVLDNGRCSFVCVHEQYIVLIYMYLCADC